MSLAIGTGIFPIAAGLVLGTEVFPFGITPGAPLPVVPLEPIHFRSAVDGTTFDSASQATTFVAAVKGTTFEP